MSVQDELDRIHEYFANRADASSEDGERIKGNAEMGLLADIEAVEKYISNAENERERLEKLVYVPGAWKCAKCRCGVISNTLHVNTGGISANNEPQECPNGCGPMWRVTERDAGNEMCDRLDALTDEKRANAAYAEYLRAELADVRSVIANGLKFDGAKWCLFKSGRDTLLDRIDAALAKNPDQRQGADSPTGATIVSTTEPVPRESGERVLPSAEATPSAQSAPATNTALTERSYLLVMGGDGYSSRIVPESQIEEAFAGALYDPPSDMPPDHRADLSKHMADPYNWRCDGDLRLTYEQRFEDGWVSLYLITNDGPGCVPRVEQLSEPFCRLHRGEGPERPTCPDCASRFPNKCQWCAGTGWRTSGEYCEPCCGTGTDPTRQPTNAAPEEKFK